MLWKQGGPGQWQLISAMVSEIIDPDSVVEVALLVFISTMFSAPMQRFAIVSKRYGGFVGDVHPLTRD